MMLTRVSTAALFAALALPAHAQMALPTDVEQSCIVDDVDFDAWFKSGSPSTDGVVTAADSVGFPTDNTACDFYKWGAQMFLWLSSPDADGLVLDSPALFNVLPAISGKRILQENDTGADLQFALRSEKVDDIGEVGQAGGGGALMSQAGALVYYGVHVNENYGYFLTRQKDEKLTQTKFPNTASDMTDLENYLNTAFPSTTLVAPETLAMEFKTSWVDASTVPDATQFVTISAQVPTYNANPNNTFWTKSSVETIELALVGMHIVGTVKNHPEFVWSTFEHILNAPDADYYYTNILGDPALQAYDSTGSFLFMETGGAATGNVECMAEIKTGAIKANTVDGVKLACEGGIVASNTYRKYPWGSLQNNQSAAVLSNNTDLLSINASIRSQLSNGDVRANYLQTGGIWTSPPTETAEAPIPDTDAFTASDLRGSLFAFNATMETYQQGSSCFSCHNQAESDPNSFQPFKLSHIYSQIVPLTAK